MKEIFQRRSGEIDGDFFFRFSFFFWKKKRKRKRKRGFLIVNFWNLRDLFEGRNHFGGGEFEGNRSIDF